MFVVTCDERQKILRANREFLAAVGRTPKEVTGQPLSNFVTIEGVATDSGLGMPARARIQGPDGHDIEISLKATEVSAGERWERTLVGEPAPFKALGLEVLPGWQCLDGIEGAVLTEDVGGFITFANSKFFDLFGFSAEEIIGRHWTSIVPPEERSDVTSQLQTRPHGQSSQYESAILTKTGSRIPVIVSARPIFQDGQYRGTVSTFTDITQRKAVESELEFQSQRLELLNQTLSMEQQRLLESTEQLTRANAELKRLSEAKSDFVAAVSHDLRTPLMTIMEGIRLTEDGALGPTTEEQRQFLHYAWEDAKRLSELINDLLDLARIERGKLTVHKTGLNLAQEIAQVRTMFENYAREHNLLLDTVPFEPELYAFCDASHFRRVMVNLLSNAVKFTPAGGRVTIRVEAGSEGMIRTSVQDTGVGIPPEQRDRLFEEFEQIRRPEAELQTGTGLGLALCRQLVELNGGKIGYESTAGSGSIFFFTLPVYTSSSRTGDSQ